jgi:hypothetical protein
MGANGTRTRFSGETVFARLGSRDPARWMEDGARGWLAVGACGNCVGHALLPGITDDPPMFGSWIELKADAAGIPSGEIHAPSDLGQKMSPVLALNSERLYSSEITAKEQAAAIIGDILREDMVGESRAMLVPSGNGQGNLQGYSFCASATAMAVCF